MNRQTSDLINLLVKEGRRRLVPLSVTFAVVAVGALAVDLAIPKKWDATALIVAESTSAIKPLMEGRAVPTAIADQSALVTQVINSKRVMREVLTFGGWLNKKKISPLDEQLLIDKLRSHIHIEAPKEQTIKVSYSDSDPKRTQLITNKVAEIYVRESTDLKEKESREAFDFVNAQVKEYRTRLADDHAKLMAYYRGQAQPVTATSADAPVADAPPPPPEPLRPHAKISTDELAELRAQEATLMAQLGKTKLPAAAPTESRQAEEQYRSRVLQLQTELDRLLVTYTDEHPDVKRAKRDLTIAKEELEHAEQARLDRENARQAATTLDDEVTQAAKARLEEVQSKIAAATGVRRRPSSAAPRLHLAAVRAAADPDPDMKGIGQDATLAELSRRYEATRDIYQDMLKRRENARVALDLDADRRGVTMRIEEAADLPIVASGLRLFQLSLIGLIIAAMVPLGYLFALVKFDTRLRSADQVERLASLPLLVSIPRAEVPNRRKVSRQGAFAAIMVVGVFVIYGAVFLVRLKIT